MKWATQATCLLVLVGPTRLVAAVLLRGALPSGCGVAPAYPHSGARDYADARATFYNATSKATETVNFAVGQRIAFKCDPGYTTDGSKDGVAEYDVECAEHGYYIPHGVCLEASRCGAVPSIGHAVPTGKVAATGVEYACAIGYSLDGEKVVAGGLGKNHLFSLKCVEFSGAYEAFEGECKAYAFVPATEAVRLYTKVYEALFVVSCKGSLKTSFGMGQAPSKLDSICASLAHESAACQALVTQIKADFESNLAARQQHDAAANATGQEWYDEKDPNRPGIGDEAQSFCVGLWQLLSKAPLSSS